MPEQPKSRQNRSEGLSEPKLAHRLLDWMEEEEINIGQACEWLEIPTPVFVSLLAGTPPNPSTQMKLAFEGF